MPLRQRIHSFLTVFNIPKYQIYRKLGQKRQENVGSRKNAVLAVFVVILGVRLLNFMGESLSFGCIFGSYQIW